MQVLDAEGKPLSIELIREIATMIGDTNGVIARIHPEQECAYENLAITVTSVVTVKGSKAAHDLLSIPFEKRMAGMLLVSAFWFANDKIRFERDYKPVAALVNLAIPTQYSHVLGPTI